MRPWLDRVRRRAPAIVALAAVAAGAAAVYSFTAAKHYEARAELLVSPLPASDRTFDGVGLPDRRLAARRRGREGVLGDPRGAACERFRGRARRRADEPVPGDALGNDPAPARPAPRRNGRRGRAAGTRTAARPPDGPRGDPRPHAP